MIRRSNGQAAGRSTKKSAFSITALLMALMMVLAACGGGDDEPAEEPADEPAAEEPADEPAAEEPADEEVTDFYAGQDLEIILPYGPGGGADTTTRLLAKYLEKHLEGVNSVFVTNVEAGGNRNVGNNQYDSMDHDGTLIGSSGATHSAWVYQQDGVEYDMAAWVPLFGVGSGLTTFARADVIAEPEDVWDPPVDLYYALTQPQGGELTRWLQIHLLGLDVEPLWGHESRGATVLSFESGESNFASETTPNYLSLIVPQIEEGTITPLFTAGLLDGNGDLQRDPVISDLPHFQEFYEEQTGNDAEADWGLGLEAFKTLVSTSYNFSKGLWIHEDAPAEAISSVKAAMRLIVEDPEFIAESEAELGGYPMLIGEELETSFQANIVDIDPAAIEWLGDWTQEEFGISFN